MVALLDENGARREGARYFAYGMPFGMPRTDCDGDGDVDSADATIISNADGKSAGEGGYDVRADVNLDGTVDSTDSSLHTSDSGQSMGRGNLSRDPTLSGGIGNRRGYAGYLWDPAVTKFHVRHRVLDPDTGRWGKRDLIGYVDGASLYEYARSRALAGIDPTGLLFECVSCNSSQPSRMAQQLPGDTGGGGPDDDDPEKPDPTKVPSKGKVACYLINSSVADCRQCCGNYFDRDVNWCDQFDEDTPEEEICLATAQDEFDACNNACDLFYDRTIPGRPIFPDEHFPSLFPPLPPNPAPPDFDYPDCQDCLADLRTAIGQCEMARERNRDRGYSKAFVDYLYRSCTRAAHDYFNLCNAVCEGDDNNYNSPYQPFWR